MSISALAGQKLSGIYRLKSPIAHGAHGVLYDAEHLITGTRYVIKILYRELYREEERLARCRRDSDMAAALHHPDIVRVIDWGRDGEKGLVYLLMERVEGENVHSRIRRQGRLSPQRVLELGMEVGNTLSAAHKLGVVHQGLTPRNLLYAAPEKGPGPGQNQRSRGENIKVLDFGIAHLQPKEAALHDLLPYRAPEQDGPEEVDGRADQFALAAILYQALSGHTPAIHDEIELEPEGAGAAGHRLPSLETLCPEAPLHLLRAIERGMAPLRSHRFPAMEEFVRALSDVRLSELPSAASLRSALSATSQSISLSTALSSMSLNPLRPASAERPLSSGSEASPRSAASSRASVRLSGAGVLPARDRQSTATLPRSSQSVQASARSQSASVNSLTPVVRSGAGSAGGSRLWPALRMALVAGIAFYLGSATHPAGEAVIGPTLPPPPPQATRPPPPTPPPPAAAVEPPLAPPEDTGNDTTPVEETQGALSEAEQALARGEDARAIEAARAALPAPQAWYVIATAACRLNDSSLSGEALAHLGTDERARVASACQKTEPAQ